VQGGTFSVNIIAADIAWRRFTFIPLLLLPTPPTGVAPGLRTTLTAPGIVDILDFEFIPFGNAIYVNNEGMMCPPLECKVEGFYSYC